MDNPWLSVITVVKDAPEEFAATAESVALQDLSGVEYLVYDSSSDTAPIVSAMKVSEVASLRYSSIAPRGIYPAMNEALGAATGDYVYFLNAGDLLHSAGVLAHVRRELAASQATWAFGRVEIVGSDGSRVETPPWDYAAEKAALFGRGLFPPHQGTFVRREALIDIAGFDPSYSIVADYAAALHLSKVADPQVLDLVVATFVEGGVSTTQWRESLRQFHRARRRILAPTGAAAALEYYRSVRQAAAMAVYRGVLSRSRQP